MLIGVDVGGTNLRVGVVDGRHVIAEQRVHADYSRLCREESPEVSLAAIHASLLNALRDAINEYPKVRGIGIGFPGFVDSVTGNISHAPNLPGLRDIDLATPLRDDLGLPVIIENDANAAAYAEFLFSEQDADLIYLGLGTGVGGGLVHRGKVFSGNHGMAMEVGHIIVEPGGRECGCGNRGCMERYASASGVILNYEEATGETLGAQAIAQRAFADDAHAKAAYSQAGDRLAQALAHILKVTDAGRVVIGGGMSPAWPLMRAAFEQRLDADLIPALRDRVRISLSALNDQAGIIGAALLAEHAQEQAPNSSSLRA
ncbi:MAG: ROK family protein [Methylobacillus sp.]|jgi:glucokinase|nr:ROK family protein [Methylobacillus sp.]